MRFLLILASGGVGRIFFTRRGQIAAPGLDSVLLAAPGGSWAGFYALWRLLGGDSGFLAASVLDFVLVAAIIRRGFWLGSVDFACISMRNRIYGIYIGFVKAEFLSDFLRIAAIPVDFAFISMRKSN